MSDHRGDRDLNRLKWATIILPVGFIWAFELVRFLVLERAYTADTTHVLAALIMGVAIVVFAALVSVYLDRTQRQLIAQNLDLSVTHAVSSAVRGGLGVPDLLEQALDRLVTETGALAGKVEVATTDNGLIVARRPIEVPDGLAWLEPLLDEPPDAELDAPRYLRRSGIDTGVLDLPLIRGGGRLGHIRLLFHPPVEPGLSGAALVDIAGEIAGAAQLGLAVADLRRRERERAALYGVALQLTGRPALPDVLDAITGHARSLLGAEGAVVCLGDPRDTGRGRPERLAVADSGSACVAAHRGGDGLRHARNPQCPLVGDGASSWAARPLRGPDGIVGELCVVRAGKPFGEAEDNLLGALADMAAIAVRTARLHEAEEQWTIHAERDRIARELHDSLAQVLGVIHLRLRALEAQARDGATVAIGEELSDIADTADEAYRDVREAILGLRETVGGDAGLEGSLREYLHKYSRQTGIVASLTCEGDTRRALTPRIEVQLLRVVQEALTNVRKHSSARRVTVRIDCATHPATLIVEDDGVGFDPATVVSSLEGGFGLASMRERVELIGGVLDVHTAPGEGTRVVVRLEAEESRGSPSAPSEGAARR